MEAPADHADAVQILVGRGDDLEVDADDEHDGGLDQRLGQHGRRRGRLDPSQA